MRRVVLSLTAMVFWAVAVPAQESTPVKLSLWHPLSTSQKTVKGVDLALVSTKTPVVYGVQWSFIYCQADTVYGAKLGLYSKVGALRGYHSSFITLSDDAIGYQDGFFVKSKKTEGVQCGIVNICDDMNGLMLGFVNYARTMKGLQVGLVNVIRDSDLPVMIIANGRF